MASEPLRRRLENAETAIRHAGVALSGAASAHDGRVIGGLTGLDFFSVELVEAEKECRQGRFRSALDRVKQLETRFSTIAAQWNLVTGSLIADIRRGRELKKLERLKILKAAQINMQRLIAPAQKALQDLAAAISQDAGSDARQSTGDVSAYRQDDSV